MKILDANTSCLLIIDPQEKLMKAVEKPEKVVHYTSLLINCASLLNIPIIATTQYKKGLGPIVQELESLLENTSYKTLDKWEFNCFYNDDFKMLISKLPSCIDSFVITGVEAHICVFQTALGAKENGFNTWIVTDAISSREKKNKKAAIRLLNSNDIYCATTEMIIYQWLKRANTQQFKSMLKYLK